ncbi:MAG: hypothetical protein MJ075_07095, partial [Oscillospiraceae bacterium]|nr:hypothetical protein [Oscillospiraceae bacterium]
MGKNKKNQAPGVRKNEIKLKPAGLLDGAAFAEKTYQELLPSAAKFGYRANPVSSTTELFLFGQKYVNFFCSNMDFQEQFNGDAAAYYLNLLCFMIEGGVIYAYEYANTPEKLLSNDYYMNLYEKGVRESFRPLLGSVFGSEESKWDAMEEDAFR